MPHEAINDPDRSFYHQGRAVAGRFEYGCLIPGHREAGMIGTIVVK